MTDDNNFVTIAKDYLMNLEQKARDAEYLRGRVDGLEYAIDAFVESLKGADDE